MGGRVRVALAAGLSALLMVGIVAGSPASAADGPTVSLGDQSGLERDTTTGSVFVPVYLSEPAAEPVVVSFHTADDSAVAGQDYTRWGTPGAPRTVTVPAGTLQSTINVPVLTDAEAEADETFTVTVSSVTGADAVLGDDTATATIVDADPVSATNPAVTVSDPTIVEGDSGQRRAQFLIHLSRAPETPVTVTYATADGSAVAGQDYVAKLPGTVVFAPGQISKTIDVLVNSDTTADAARSFTLDVIVTGGSPVEELHMAGTATITDDDAAGPALCAPGTYNSTNGAEPCTPAPAGFFVDTEGALAATPCTPGRFQDQPGQASCQLAPLGSYVEFSGAVAAALCPDGTTTNALGATSPDDCVPEQVADAVAIAAGSAHTCAVLDDGTARCWGENGNGQLGNGTTDDTSVPVAVSGLTDAIDIVTGTAHSCALLADGTARCWGLNAGQLGNGTSGPGASSTVPVTVSGLADAVDLAAGINHSCALLADGTARCWGVNGQGQLGSGFSGSGTNSNVPLTVAGLTDTIAISAVGNTSCAALADGTARCWGGNSNGQLGDGTTTDSNVPVAVSGLTDTVAIATGGAHTCAVLADGAARCWGFNGDGRLGNGTNTESCVPVVVSGLSDAVAITAGAAHSCARLADGTARCWGNNGLGRLGNGISGGTSNVPVVVSNLTDAVDITAGSFHTCAVLSDGGARCWGAGADGRLGDGTTTNSNLPVPVVGLP